MREHDLTRRLFLKGAGSVAGTAALRGLLPAIAATAQAACTARDSGAAFAVLGADEAAALEAITARIIPTTETPGAREAGVVHFIDQAMDGFMAGQLGMLREGLAGFLADLDRPFADLDEDAQDAYLAARENTPFFEFLGVLTLFGTFALPSYGGNRGEVGWQILGMDARAHAHAPPFGHYDAVYREDHADAD